MLKARQEWWDAKVKPGTPCLPIRRQVSALTNLAACCCTVMQDIAACLVSSLSLSETTEGMLLLHCRAATTPVVYPSSQWAAAQSNTLSLPTSAVGSMLECLQVALSKAWKLS